MMVPAGTTSQASDVASPQDLPTPAFVFDGEPMLNPHNWSRPRKIIILCIIFNLIISSTNGTSLASGGVRSTIEEFGIHYSPAFAVLPTSIYLIGYFSGNVVFAPLSELYGRRSINLVTSFMYMVWLMASALAPNWPAFVAFRLLSGFFAAGPPSTVSGICADLYGESIHRGRAVLGFNIANNLGPVLGPIISGYAEQITWRLSFWIGLAYAGVCFLALICVPETNHDVILEAKAKDMHKSGLLSPTAKADHVRKWISWTDILTKVLLRPMSMFFREPLVFLTCLYLAFLYAVFYMFLQSYPIIFIDIYGFTSGEEGLTFLGFGLGVLFALPAQYAFEAFYARAISQGRAWTNHHGARRLPPAFCSGPLIVLSLFWSAWTSRTDIHWISPALSSIPYGLGYTLNFTSLLNYLVDSYASYASSANAASSLTRQILGAALPFAVVPMYEKLGVAWSSTLLGLVAVIMSFLPLGFWWYGDKILARSKFAQQLALEEADIGRMQETT